MPAKLTLDLAGVPATATYTNPGQVDDFGLMFSGAGDQLFLSTAGADGPFRIMTPRISARRSERLLVAMTADSGRRLSSIDLLDEGEHARLDEWGNRAVLTPPETPPVSIPAVFAAAQVARAPEAVAIRAGDRSWTLPRG